MTIAECAENARQCEWYASTTNNPEERKFLTSHGETLEKNGGGERTRSAEGCAIGRLVLERLRG